MLENYKEQVTTWVKENKRINSAYALHGTAKRNQGYTRPDIEFAVSQVCRFSNSPRKSHATAVKMILRYLKKTMDKGTIISPTKNKLDLQMYVDADYASLYGVEKFEDPISVRSRTGGAP